MKPEDPAGNAPAAPGGWRKAAKVFAVLGIIAAVLLISVMLMYIDDMCVRAGHRWSWFYTFMVVAAAGPIIIFIAWQILLPLTSLSLEAIRSICLLALLVCVPFWAFTIYATDQMTAPGAREEPRGPAFCYWLRR